ncbi:MAG: glycosyltransferase family 2 protein, partial [Proteobacteria bacterium]|nr:glycosyltransferase family 2 protein [Pseudomonadota bacterium]
MPGQLRLLYYGGIELITVSLCMIVKNEEKVLTRCLDSVKDLVDEIIIVDTGSTDKTKDIALKYTSNLYDFEWIDDFAAARNYSFSKATMDYILWLDADDVFLEEDRIKFKQVKESMDSNIDVVMMKYNLVEDEGENLTISIFRERLIKRSNHFMWHEPVHEYLDIDGKIANSNICVTHKSEKGISDRNLKIYEKGLAKNGTLNHRNTFYYARELFLNGRYDDAIIYYQKFLDTEGGYLCNYIEACIDLSKCY